jgi:hypothetical protein
MIHAATSEELKQEFIRDNTRDFDIRLEKNIPTFLGIVIEQSQEGIDIQLSRSTRST